MAVISQEISDKFALYEGDCIEVMQDLMDDDEIGAGIGKGNWSASGRIAPASDIVFRKSRLVFAIVQSYFLLKKIVL